MGRPAYTAPGGSPPMAGSPSLCHPRPGGDINVGHMSQARREFRRAPRKKTGLPANPADRRARARRPQPGPEPVAREAPASQQPGGPRAHRARAPLCLYGP
ncbi:unnamed protein product [Rangifer tarandus platyrhynchus]|uniref:Uncharacterized protein n=2 Tax=Rangifer tarandus platyrhynchus TaxID=3082113 RepID=A0ABN8YZZ2_RANTA|nr:unnamed protein product [Rangifer tarandus platyrhynchus]CAI9705322.1 unnamed protein product [Rangifer tarandus platyrhynchus]